MTELHDAQQCWRIERLFLEMESFMVAIQDQVIPVRSYQRNKSLNKQIYATGKKIEDALLPKRGGGK